MRPPRSQAGQDGLANGVGEHPPDELGCKLIGAWKALLHQLPGVCDAFRTNVREVAEGLHHPPYEGGGFWIAAAALRLHI